MTDPVVGSVVPLGHPSREPVPGTIFSGADPAPKQEIVSAAGGMKEPAPGVKYDGGKAKWHLLPWREVGQVVDVLTWATVRPINPYPDDNWKDVKPRSRYWSAMFRHLTKRLLGQRNDPEDNLPHLAHAACCLLFLMWADNEGEEIT